MVDIWWDCFMCPCCGQERPKRRRQTRLGRSRDWIDMDWLIFVHQETWADISTETFGERVTSQLLANSNRTSFAVAEYRVAYCSTRPGHFPNIAWPLSCAFVSQEVAGVAQNLFKCRYCLTKARWFLDVLSYCNYFIPRPITLVWCFVHAFDLCSNRRMLCVFSVKRMRKRMPCFEKNDENGDSRRLYTLDASKIPRNFIGSIDSCPAWCCMMLHDVKRSVMKTSKEVVTVRITFGYFWIFGYGCVQHWSSILQL